MRCGDSSGKYGTQQRDVHRVHDQHGDALELVELPGDQRRQHGQQHQAEAEGHVEHDVLPEDGQRLAGDHAAQGQYEGEVDDVRAHDVADGQAGLPLDDGGDGGDQFRQRGAHGHQRDADDALRHAQQPGQRGAVVHHEPGADDDADDAGEDLDDGGDEGEEGWMVLLTKVVMAVILMMMMEEVDDVRNRDPLVKQIQLTCT